jgi:hypothetical protein
MIKIIIIGSNKIKNISHYLLGNIKYYSYINIDYNIEHLYIDLEYCDILIIEEYDIKYNNNFLLDINLLISNTNENANIIIIPFIDFYFYFPDLTEISISHLQLLTPDKYHYKSIINIFNDQKSIFYNEEDSVNYKKKMFDNSFSIIDNINENKNIDNNIYAINNINLYDKTYIDNIAINTILEVKNIYNDIYTKYKKNIYKKIYCIDISKIIEENYKETLLYYTPSNLSKDFYILILNNICDVINIKKSIINNNSEIEENIHILYKCIDKCVNFNTKKYKSSILNKTNIKNIIKLYFSIYNKNIFLLDNYKYNNISLNLPLNSSTNFFHPEIYRFLNDDLKNISLNNLKKHYNENYVIENRKYIYTIPDDFDINIYRVLNDDLLNLSDIDICSHYIKHCDKEKRPYKNIFPSNFNIELYKILNDDLCNMSNNLILNHFIKNNINENRIYFFNIPIDFNIKIYKLLNIDLINLSRIESIIHFIKFSKSENRIYKLSINKKKIKINISDKIIINNILDNIVSNIESKY